MKGGNRMGRGKKGLDIHTHVHTYTHTFCDCVLLLILCPPSSTAGIAC